MRNFHFGRQAQFDTIQILFRSRRARATPRRRTLLRLGLCSRSFVVAEAACRPISALRRATPVLVTIWISRLALAAITFKTYTNPAALVQV